MKKILLLSIAFVLAGCGTPAHEWYKNQGWTPDSFNYTYETDNRMRPSGHYFGASWDLKGK